MMPISESRLRLSVTLVSVLLYSTACPKAVLAQDRPLEIPPPAAVTGYSDAGTAGDTNTVGNAQAAAGSNIASPVLKPAINPTAAANDTRSTTNLVAAGTSVSTTVADSSANTAAASTSASTTAADSSANTAPAGTSGNAAPASTSAKSGSKTSSFGRILKTNLIETFELDPGLKKELTEGDPLLRPIKLIEDHFSAGYNPTITWQRDAGPPWQTSYNTRAMSLYEVGPVTKHLSNWFQMLPQSTSYGFFPKFELFQGMANYGSDKNFIQIRGGQSFNWQNAGWGGADRTITQTSPGVYTPLNGFDPTAVSKTISGEITGMNWTTGKVFGYWQPSAQTSSDPNVAYASRGEGVGLSVEKLIGKTGISGVQSNLTMGNTRLFNGNTDVFGNVIGSQASPFVRWTSWINKSFQDKKGYVRLNPSFGLTVFKQRQYVDDPTVPENRSTGYGYTFDLVTIPVLSYWTMILRYDQFRATNLANANTTYTFTVGQALDFHLPKKGRIRLTLDYQLIGQRESAPSHRIILGFWPIW
jgi:hypothetical protein